MDLKAKQSTFTRMDSKTTLSTIHFKTPQRRTKTSETSRTKFEGELGSYGTEVDHWNHLSQRVRLVTSFSKHVKDKELQRKEINEFISKMKARKETDAKELLVARNDESRIRTMRPKSAATRMRPIPNTDVPTWKPYEVPPGTACYLCKIVFKPFREYEGYPCRICSRHYHKECLKKCGKMHPSDEQTMEMAKTNLGWSCYICSNLALLLTDEEFRELTWAFDKADSNQDLKINLQEFINFKCKKTLKILEKNLRTDERQKLTDQFHFMDLDGDNLLDWWEFVNHECKIVLARRDKRDLVDLLTEKEIVAAKATFSILDVDGDGRIKEYEAIRAYKDWYRQFEKRRQSETVIRDSSLLDFHAVEAAKFIMQADIEGEGDVSWDKFLLNQALYIICSRPNMLVKKR